MVIKQNIKQITESKTSPLKRLMKQQTFSKIEYEKLELAQRQYWR